MGSITPGRLSTLAGCMCKSRMVPRVPLWLATSSASFPPLHKRSAKTRGIKNFYTDEGLTNGIQYTYAVTSFDTGNPKTGLIAMESSQIETMVHVTPRANPAGHRDATAELADNAFVRTGSVTVEPMIIAPKNVTGHQYKMVWYGAKPIDADAYITGPGYQPPAYEIIDMTTNQTVVEKQSFGWYDPTQIAAVEALSPMFDGITLKIKGVDVTYGHPNENPIESVKLTKGDGYWLECGHPVSRRWGEHLAQHLVVNLLPSAYLLDILC